MSILETSPIGHKDKVLEMKKVLFISSTGGHLSELLQLAPLFKKYDYHIITEKEAKFFNIFLNIQQYVLSRCIIILK